MARPKGSKNKPHEYNVVEPVKAPEAVEPIVSETAASPMPNPSPEPQTADAATIQVETAGNYQLFDLMTNKVYAHDKPTECDPNNPFVVREMEKGRLKEVK